MSEINRGLDHMANLQRGWSPGQAMLPPDPDGLNRALDRAAAEHLREVAPHLAPSAPVPPQPEPRTCHCGAYTASECECRKRAPNAPPQLERDELGRLCVNGQPHRPADPRMLGAPFCVVCYHPLAPAPPAEAKHHEEDCVCRECRPEMHSAQPPAEAKGEEMTAVGLRIALDAFYRQGYYAGMADMSGNREMVQEHADRAEVAVKPVLDAFAALRTRAREAEERAEKTTEHLLNSVAKAVRRGDELESERDEARQEARWLAEVFIATGHATPDIHAWLDRAKHCVGTLRESLTAANERVDALLLERDEAREQREDLANEILAERSDLAAANARAEALSTLRAATVKIVTEALDGAPVVSAVTDLDTQSAREKAARLYARAEEAERRALMAGQDKVAAQRRADSSHRLMENERAARVAAEAQREAYRQDRDLTAHRLTAAEAEVARLNGVVDEHAADAMRAGLERAKTERRLREATEEIVRVRLAYDDPSRDATDGAHPAWWRGSDAGVAGAVRIVNEALDGPLPLPGCVGGADLEAVRQRVAALRASVARLVEAGEPLESLVRRCRSIMYDGADVDKALVAWAAAKAGREEVR